MIGQFLAVANQAADRARELLQGFASGALSVEQKSDDSPVTQADRAVESAIRAIISAAFPDHGIFGEEEARTNPNAKYQWVIDPIDGTRPFIAGYATFTTLIALAEDGVPILGIIDQPIMQQRWVGAHSQPTLFNGAMCHTLSTPLVKAPIATTSTYYFSPAQAAGFERLRKGSAGALLGGDAYAYAMLATGRLGAVVDAGMKPYDFMALVPVIKGAGGMITDWQGKPVTLASKGDVIAAANAKLHREVAELLA